MSVHVLRRQQVVPGDLETVFTFFESPRNLEEITPPWLRFEVVSTTDESMRCGTEIEYRLRWQGIPMRWRSHIAEYEPMSSFADEMLSGPYRSWYHRHLFRQVQSGIEMVDVVEYELPLGGLGRWVHAVLVRAQLESIFDHRRDAVAARFRGPHHSVRGIAVAEGGSNEPHEDEAGLADVRDERRHVEGRSVHGGQAEDHDEEAHLLDNLHD